MSMPSAAGITRLATWALLIAPAFAPSYARDLPDFAGLVRQHGTEVVNVSTLRAVKRLAGSVEPAPPEGSDDELEGDGPTLGSGFIISADGYLITCTHVVEGATEIVVRLADRREYRARLIGADRRSDIALLKIDADNLRAVVIGDPARLRVGDWVLAIGAPFGFDSSATSGIVSAKGRSLPSENYVSFLQTDVVINPGNSGGPLYNLKGEVVGVNSQIYSRTGTFMGVSFAIPIDIAMRIAEQLKSRGAVRRGWLGMSLQEVTQGLAAAYGLDRPRGALIADVLPGGPAARSDLRPGDIVLEYEGRPIGLSSELPPLVGLTAPGTRARFKLFRRDHGMTEVVASVGELREEPLTKAALAVPRTDAGYRLGLVLSELSAADRRRYEVSSGLHVDDVLDGPGREAGLRVGDVITEVDGRPVTGLSHFYRSMAQVNPRRPALLRVRRGAASVYLALSPQ